MPAGAGAAFGAVADWAGTAAGAATLTSGAVGLAGAAASKFLGPKPPGAPGPMPTLKTPDGSAAADAASLRARGASGLGSTNLTGPQGLTAPATTAQKSLLGG